MLQALVAKQREWKKRIIIICKNRSVPFHIDHFYSEWTEKPSFLHFSLENFIFPRMKHIKCNKTETF